MTASPSLRSGSTTCALDASGSALCWGENVSGQLGIGSRDKNRNTVNAPSYLQLAEASRSVKLVWGRK
jgi:hypothetical protein